MSVSDSESRVRPSSARRRSDWFPSDILEVLPGARCVRDRPTVEVSAAMDAALLAAGGAAGVSQSCDTHVWIASVACCPTRILCTGTYDKDFITFTPSVIHRPRHPVIMMLPTSLNTPGSVVWRKLPQ